MMADYDSELMLRVAEGEHEAFKELFERNYSRAVNVAYRSLGDKDHAEDIAMDAFARVFQARNTYKPTAKFTTYLHRIVINLCLNAAKRRRAVGMESLNENSAIASASSDPATRVERQEKAEAVRRAVLSLPANQRTALVLTKYEGLSYEEAADAMSTSVKAVESLLHRAKKTLRVTLRGLMDSA